MPPGLFPGVAGQFTAHDVLCEVSQVGPGLFGMLLNDCAARFKNNKS